MHLITVINNLVSIDTLLDPSKMHNLSVHSIYDPRPRYQIPDLGISTILSNNVVTLLIARCYDLPSVLNNGSDHILKQVLLTVKLTELGLQGFVLFSIYISKRVLFYSKRHVFEQPSLHIVLSPVLINIFLFGALVSLHNLWLISPLIDPSLLYQALFKPFLSDYLEVMSEADDAMERVREGVGEGPVVLVDVLHSFLLEVLEVLF